MRRLADDGDCRRQDAIGSDGDDNAGVAGHPNRIPFEGVLTVVDEASTRAPSGARGHRVILARAAALEALPSLLGMAVGCTRTGLRVRAGLSRGC